MFRIIPRRAFSEPTVRLAGIERDADGSTAALRIDGLLCGLCATNVERQLKRVEGVRDATVRLDTGEAAVRCEIDTDTNDLLAAVESAIVLRPVRRLLARIGGAAA